jgi:hypothetical protein
MDASAINKEMLKQIAHSFITLLQKDNIIASNCGAH